MCHCAIKWQWEFHTEKRDVHGRRKDFIDTVMDSESAVNSMINIRELAEIALVFKHTGKSKQNAKNYQERNKKLKEECNCVTVQIGSPFLFVIHNSAPYSQKGYRIVGTLSTKT